MSAQVPYTQIKTIEEEYKKNGIFMAHKLKSKNEF